LTLPSAGFSAGARISQSHKPFSSTTDLSPLRPAGQDRQISEKQLQADGQEEYEYIKTHGRREEWNKSMAEQPGEIRTDPVIEHYKRDIDGTLIIENLKLTVEERFVRLMKLQEFAEELRRARRQEGADHD
jgi:hypothetical protein